MPPAFHESQVEVTFSKEYALVRAHEKAMMRYTDSGDEARRPDLGQKISEYHLGLTARLNEKARAAALAALQRAEPAHALAAVAEALRVRLEPAELPGLHLLTLTGCAPELVFAGEDPAQAAEAALAYVRRALLSDAERPLRHPSPLSMPYP